MSQLVAAIDDLQKSIEKLTEKYEGLKAKNHQLKTENESLSGKLEEQKNTIAKLEDKNKVVKLAKSMSENGGGGTRDVKYKINELVREIDKCMALLNN